MKRIDELTPAMQARRESFADEWIEWATDTTPVDHESVEAGIRACYRFAGLSEPKRIVWVQSPVVVGFAGPIAAHLLDGRVVDGAVRDAVDGAVGDVVGGAVGDVVDGAVRDAVDGAVGDVVDGAVRDAVDGAVRGAVRGAVDGAVRGAVDGAVRGVVDGAVRDVVGDVVDGAVRDVVDGAWWKRVGGQWWAGWLAWQAFFREAGLTLDIWDRLDAYTAANQAGWWWPHREFVIVSERPTELHREQVGARGWGSHQMHNANGPAVAWGDEWALWVWHGRQVPEWVITDPTVERIAGEPNVEVRRCAIEHLGWDRYIDKAGMRPVAECDDPGNPGQTLGLFTLPDDTETRVLLATNGSLERDGTRRRYGLPVPAHCRTPIEAAAWTYDIDPKTYAQLARRT